MELFIVPLRLSASLLSMRLDDTDTRLFILSPRFMFIARAMGPSPCVGDGLPL